MGVERETVIVFWEIEVFPKRPSLERNQQGTSGCVRQRNWRVSWSTIGSPNRPKCMMSLDRFTMYLSPRSHNVYGLWTTREHECVPGRGEVGCVWSWLRRLPVPEGCDPEVMRGMTQALQTSATRDLCG